jgi:UDP-N-acetylmuramate dehydrogenase
MHPLIQENVPLKDHMNYKIGGPAKYFATPTTIEELKEVLNVAQQHAALPTFIIGSGTNILVSDGGYNGFVIKPNLQTINVNGMTIEAGAGLLVKDLVEAATVNSLSGLEWAGGLPGTVGGAIRGNAGAFGGETKDSILAVRTLDTRTGEETIWTNAECHFGYRNSIFKDRGGELLIVSATFALGEGDASAIASAVQEKVDYRVNRHPLEYPNIGSTFKNVPTNEVNADVLTTLTSVIKNDPFPVVPAAYLISETGLKGTQRGGAMISPKHPNFIVNVGGASSHDVEQLIQVIKDAVKEKYGIKLEEEVMRLQ